MGIYGCVFDILIKQIAQRWKVGIGDCFTMSAKRIVPAPVLVLWSGPGFGLGRGLGCGFLHLVGLCSFLHLVGLGPFWCCGCVLLTRGGRASLTGGVACRLFLCLLVCLDVFLVLALC